MPQSAALSELKFVVVGAKGAGKSQFIRCALDLKEQGTGETASKKMSLDGQLFVIRLIEVQLDDVEVTEDKAIHWPEAIKAAGVSEVDGVAALYDVTDRDTLSGIPVLLNACSKNNIPCVLVSCKCDVPAGQRKLEPREIEKSCMKETGIEGCQTHLNKPETHKRCISVVLRNAMLNSSSSKFGQRPRALTTGGPGSGPSRPNIRRYSNKGHNRTASEAASNAVNKDGRKQRWAESQKLPSLSDSDSDDTDVDESKMPPPTDPTMKSQSEYRGNFRALSKLKTGDEDLDPDGAANDRKLSAVMDTPTTIANSFLEDAYDDEELRSEHSESSKEVASNSDIELGSPGYNFEELVDRLVAQPFSKADSKFIAIFLCLYRKFAAPLELMSAMRSRFDSLRNNDEPPILRLSSQLRVLNIFAQWLCEYPGDFAHPFTKDQLCSFIDEISDNRIFAVAASEMRTQAEQIVEDDDTYWACSDFELERTKKLDTYRKKPQGTASLSREVQESLLAHKRSGSANRKRQSRHSQTPSTVSSVDRAPSVSSLSTVLSSVEAAQRQADALNPVPRILMSKIQWHQFIEMSEDEIAKEMTRIDWIMYSAIRPRDLIRHVSLHPGQRDSCKNLVHVNRMINQFNHIAFWVANIVLLREKPKHRAQAIEKFIGIAKRLRQLNNYNSLGAVIAGINGTAVHRLKQSRDLVPIITQKEFMKLEILMGTQKSHFAYRLAWENTLMEKIPFLPLHRRDLVSAEEGNATFESESSDRVNWKKFEIMGDVVISIQKSQGTPYPHIQRNADAQRLILECKFSKDDDELYERSVQLEGPGANEPRRRFNWFQR